MEAGARVDRAEASIDSSKSSVKQNRAAARKRSSKMLSSESLNHLLNFMLPPRQTVQNAPRRSRKTTPGYGVWNKEKFVNAQFRFVMKPSGDYTVHFADPDIFFQWQDILQVIIPRKSAFAAAIGRQEHSTQDEGYISCPICLSPPSAPRITKCGHVFCFPCVLRYLKTSDHGKWARCPICFDSINEGQLKSVKWLEEPADDGIAVSAPGASSSFYAEPSSDSPHPGSTLRMRLIERPQMTTLALPRSPTWPSILVPPHQAPLHFLPDVYRFSRFMLATPAYIVADLSRDLDELEDERKSLAGMKDNLSIAYVELAEERVRQQIQNAAVLETVDLTKTIARVEQSMHEIEQSKKELNNRISEQSQLVQSAVANEDLYCNYNNASSRPPSSRSLIRPRRNLNPPPPSTPTYHFYQAASGAAIFLHPLDIRILLSNFNSHSAFPDEISVRVEASSEGSIDSEFRRRYKYLSHMPESADVVFIEADLTGVVSEETLHSFEAPLRTRRTKRREKAKKDERARSKAEELEREKLRIQSAPAMLRAGSERGHPDAGTISDVVGDEPTPGAVEGAVESIARPASGSAWGQRSFAAALSSNTSRASPRGDNWRETSEEIDWDVDAAWHDLEARHLGGGDASSGGNGGGRKKRSTKLVVLGGTGGRKRY